MAEWKNTLIETDVDRLMEYLRNEREVRVGEAAESLGLEEETVMEWARSLRDAGLVEINYTARRGRILSIVEEEVEEDRIEEVKEGASEKLEDLEKLRQEARSLERFEDILDRLKENLEEEEDIAEGLRERFSGMDDELESFREYMDDLESVEGDVESLRKDIEEIQNDVKVIVKLAENLEEKKETGDEGGGFLSGLKSHLPLVGKGGKATFKCEECEREFDTEIGMKIHRGKVHDD